MLKKSWLLTAFVSSIGIAAAATLAREETAAGASSEFARIQASSLRFAPVFGLAAARPLADAQGWKPAGFPAESGSEKLTTLQCGAEASEASETRDGGVWFVGCGGVY